MRLIPRHRSNLLTLDKKQKININHQCTTTPSYIWLFIMVLNQRTPAGSCELVWWICIACWLSESLVPFGRKRQKTERQTAYFLGKDERCNAEAEGLLVGPLQAKIKASPPSIMDPARFPSCCWKLRVETTPQTATCCGWIQHLFQFLYVHYFFPLSFLFPLPFSAFFLFFVFPLDIKLSVLFSFLSRS